MVMYVPYRPAVNNTAADMIASRLQSTGTRAFGALPVYRCDARQVPGGFSGYMPTRLPQVAYAPTRRMKLGALGITGSQAATGAKAGVAASGAATSIATGVASAVGAGAAAGSVVPVIGTAIGAIVGLLASGILDRKDQEIQNFDQAVAIWQQSRLNVLNIANKYLVLAGLFDLKLNNPHIPIYLQYGRMGEQRFVNDMMQRVYQAAKTGQISATDTPDTIMNRIVQPWIDSFGKGPMQDPHGDMIDLILRGMIADYVAGQQGRWLARGGDFPFGNLPPFPLQDIIARSQPPAVVGPAPLPVAVQPTPVTAPANIPSAVLPTAGPPLVFVAPQAPVVAPAPIQAPPVVAPIQGPPLAPVPILPQPQGSGGVQTLPAIPQLKQQPSFPSGFTLVGQDSTGNPVYANAQGVLYQWTGAAMVAFTGSLSGQVNIQSQIQAAIQQALAQGQTQAQAAATGMAAAQSAGVPVTPQLQQQVSDQTAVTATSPPQVQAAGVGALLSGPTGLLVIAGVLGVLFATARPAKHG